MPTAIQRMIRKSLDAIKGTRSGYPRARTYRERNSVDQFQGRPETGVFGDGELAAHRKVLRAELLVADQGVEAQAAVLLGVEAVEHFRAQEDLERVAVGLGGDRGLDVRGRTERRVLAGAVDRDLPGRHAQHRSARFAASW